MGDWIELEMRTQREIKGRRIGTYTLLTTY